MGLLQGEEIKSSFDRVTITDSGGNILQTMKGGATPTFNFGPGFTLGTPLNTVNLVTVQVANHAQASTYTLPDTNTNASFVMTELAQTINGQKTVGTGMTLGNNVNITLGAGTGSTIGTNASQKLGFYGTTAAVRPVSSAGFTNAAGGATNGDLVVQVNNVVGALRTLGLVAVA